MINFSNCFTMKLMAALVKRGKLIVSFSEVDKADIPLVGGKGANLGELASSKFPVPPGFIITVEAYRDFLEENTLSRKIREILASTNPDLSSDLQRASSAIEKLIKNGTVPKETVRQVFTSYKKLGGLFSDSLVAVRSSATAEDLPQASFAGQQATFLNVKGEANLIEALKDCWASLFTPRAIFYRKEQKIAEGNVLIAVVVQKMIQSEISGVAFTVDPVTQEKNMMLIEAIWGLGEMLVQGQVTPDRYRVGRQDLDLVSAEVGEQVVELIKSGRVNREKHIPQNRQNKQKLAPGQIKELAGILKRIHQHYYFPQDIEWAYAKGKFYIVQTRPITTLTEILNDKKSIRHLSSGSVGADMGRSILKGVSASPGIASGPVRKIKSNKELSRVKKGDVLVTSMTSPDFVPAMRRANAIVTDLGGQTSHAAIVSRELGIPSVVGTKNATSFLKEGIIVTVDGAKGLIYKGGYRGAGPPNRGAGEVAPVISETSGAGLPAQAGAHLKTATKIYVNLAEPERAAEIAKRNADGVGLLRAEFMMANIGIHPKQVLKDKKQKVFIERLASDLKTFCEAFYPRPVVYRASDFKSNEYRNLKGGKAYEPEEPNPLMGFRGAFRYIKNPEVFELELSALKKVRDGGLKNLWLMIPYVRSPEELLEVKKIVTSAGLTRGPTFKFWLMVELPTNVILIDDFIDVGIDGISVGSNDLTMLILGTDRDNEEVSEAFNERSPAVLWALKTVINACRKRHVTSSICGQAPSVYDDLVRQLVHFGITSISVNPDSIERVREVVYEAEKGVAARKHG